MNHNGSIGGAGAERVEVRASAVREVHGEDVHAEASAVRQLAAEHARLTGSAAGLVRAGYARVESSNVGVLAAREVECTQTRALVVVSLRSRGDVRALFDMRGALAFGAGYFLARAALRWLRRTLA